MARFELDIRLDGVYLRYSHVLTTQKTFFDTHCIYCPLFRAGCKQSQYAQREMYFPRFLEPGFRTLDSLKQAGALCIRENRDHFQKHRRQKHPSP